MSFELELHADVQDWSEAHRASAATASPGYVTVVPGQRRRWGRPLRPSILFEWERGQEVFSDNVDWSEVAFSLSDEGRQNLARTVLTLARVLESGWGVRAYWTGDPPTGEQWLSAAELVGLVERSALDRGTLYRVG